MKQLCLAFLLLILLASPCRSETVTLQPAAAAGMDTMIVNNAATTNYGTNAVVNVGENNTTTDVCRGLVKFDLTSIPATAVLDSVELKLKVAQDLSSNARTLKVFRLKRAWVEAEATWNVYSTGNSWSTAGGFHADDCESTEIGSKALSATEAVDSVVTVVLTPRNKADLDLGNGYLLKMDTETDDLYGYHSSDHATGSYRPQLVVKYHLLGNSVILVQ